MRRARRILLAATLIPALVLADTPDAGPDVPDAGPDAVELATTAALSGDPFDFGTGTAAYFKLLLTAVTSSNWFFLASLLLIGVVWGVRRWGAKKWPWLATDRGSVATVFLLAVLGGVAVSFAAGAAPGLAVFVAALKVGVTSIGGFHGLKRFIFPQDLSMAEKPKGIAGIVEVKPGD